MYLYGASGHSKVIIDIIKSSTNKTIEGVFDDNITVKTVLEYPVLKFDSYKFDASKELIISIGNNKFRKNIAAKINANYINAFHKTAVVSEFSKIGKGTVVMPGAIVNSAAVIGEHCIINSRAVVEHDCVLGDFVHVSPNTSIAGNVEIGEGAHIGIGATVIQGVKIGNWVTVGAGAVVLKDIPDNATVVGNPAKVIKIKNEA